MSTNRSVEEWTARYPGGASSPGFPRIAEAMLREGRTEEGIALAGQGLQMQPGSLSGHLVLARLYQAAERLDEAKTEFETVLRMDPRCPSARFHLAQIAERLQWKSVALEHWRQLCDIEPWDETAREAYGRMLREAPGGSAEPKLTQPFQPFAPEAKSNQPSSQPGDHALGFGASSAFMPAEETTSEDLADALPSASDWAFPAVNDGATLEMPVAKEYAAAMPTPPALEPAPENILKAEPSTQDDSQLLSQPAPFSGSDVASRLNDIFGLPQDPEASPAEEAVADQEEMAQTEAHAQESTDSKPSYDDMGITQFQPVESDAVPNGEEQAPEILLADEHPQLTETTDFDRAGETGFLEGPAVDGDDIADRLDQIFSTSDTQMQEVVKSSHIAPQQDGVESNWTPVIPGFAEPQTQTGEPETQPAESEARAAGESNILEREAVHGENLDSLQGEVTGNDIADRLDALFEESASASSMMFKAPVETEKPVEATPEVESARPVSNPFHDDNFSGRETMILSVDGGFDSEPPTSGSNFLGSDSLTAPGAFGTDNIETVDLKPAMEAIQFETADALTPESLGLPEIDGGDVGDRLDSLFGSETEVRPMDAPPKANTAKATSVDFLQGEDSVPLEMALAPSSDLDFETTVQEPAVVSGDDISSRLAEIFGDDEGDTEEKTIVAQETPSQEMEAFARGTHLEPTEAAILTTEQDASSGTQDFPVMTLDENGGAAVADTASSAAIQDDDFPPWLSETEENVPSAGTSGDTKATLAGEEPLDDEEAFEPGTTSIATVTLAEIYFTQGLKEQALQIYRQLLDREPDNESAKKRIQEIEASKADGDDKGSGPDDSRPRPGLKIPRRKK
jgi:cytochrome c-type biogenesis protein CcmH/NrfG